MKKSLATLLIGAMFGAGPALAGGIPVIDIANNTAVALNQATNIVQFTGTVTQLKNNLEQAKMMFNAMNGVRGMGALINNPNARQYLPKSAAQLYSLDVGGAGNGFPGLSGSLQAIKTAAQIMKPADVANSTTGALLNRQQDQLARMQATAEASYDAAGARFDTLQQLVNHVDLANDPKAAADLANRINAENAMMQNEITKLNMLAMIHNAQERQLAQQGHESIAKLGKGQPVYVNEF
jgi:type IV secretion system protein VirB5